MRVRQAINYALDKQTFVDTIIEGRGTVANSYINSMIPGWTDEVEAYPYDPAKAKELCGSRLSERIRMQDLCKRRRSYPFRPDHSGPACRGWNHG